MHNTAIFPNHITTLISAFIMVTEYLPTFFRSLIQVPDSGLDIDRIGG